MGSARALVATSGVWPACTCLVSNAQPAAGSVSGVVITDVSWECVGGALGARIHGRGWFNDDCTTWASASGFPVYSGGPSWRARACRVADRPARSDGYSTWSITRGTPPRLEGCRP